MNCRLFCLRLWFECSCTQPYPALLFSSLVALGSLKHSPVSLLGLERPWGFPWNHAGTECFLPPVRAEVGSYMPRGKNSPFFWNQQSHLMTQEEGVISKGQTLGECLQKWNAQVIKPLSPTPNTLLCDAGRGIQTSEEGSMDFLDLGPLRRDKEVDSGSIKRGWNLKPTATETNYCLQGNTVSLG